MKNKDEEMVTKKDSLPKKIFKVAIEWIICFIIAYVIYLIINYFFGTVSCIRQSSMYPTAIEGERVTVQRSRIFKKDLKYGDIIIFEAPLSITTNVKQDQDNVIAKYNDKKGFESFTYNFLGIGKMEYIKRVIGLPGDHIEIKEDGTVYRNEEKIEENYLTDTYTTLGGNYFNIVVPDDCIYVMGDNRIYSKDSRYFGCIPMEKITGYVGIRIWPFNRLGEI